MKSPLISICIPTYEMHGRGVEFLNHSIVRLLSQTFQDFEIVISDHSMNDAIERYCAVLDRRNVRYIRNTMARGNSSANINNAIQNARGKIIKVLFQDDFLIDDHALQIQITHFHGNTNYWMVTACCHTDNNGMTYHDAFYPAYHDDIHHGRNTISSPSVLMFRNENVELFDENLIWLMDVDYYKRLYITHGLPSICNYITVVNRRHPNQISNTLATETIKAAEVKYLLEKYKK